MGRCRTHSCTFIQTTGFKTMSGEERGRCRTHSCTFIQTTGFNTICLEKRGVGVGHTPAHSSQTTGFNTMSESLYCYLWFTNTSDCRESDILGQLAWIIPVSIIAGIILLGVILLVIAKCILMAVVSLLPPLFNISSALQCVPRVASVFYYTTMGVYTKQRSPIFLLGSSLHCRCCKQCSYITLG